MTIKHLQVSPIVIQIKRHNIIRLNTFQLMKDRITGCFVLPLNPFIWLNIFTTVTYPISLQNSDR